MPAWAFEPGPILQASFFSIGFPSHLLYPVDIVI